MKSNMRIYMSFVLVLFAVSCAIVAGESSGPADKDELLDRVTTEKLPRQLTTNDDAEDSDPFRVTPGVSRLGRDDRTVIDTRPRISAMRDTPFIDADSSISGYHTISEELLEADQLLTVDGSASAATLPESKVTTGDSRSVVWDAKDSDDDGQGIHADQIELDDVTDGSGQDEALPQADDPSLFDQELVGILQKRPESREFLESLGLSAKPSNTHPDPSNPQALKEHLKELLTRPVSERKYHKLLPTLPEEVEADPMLQPLQSVPTLPTRPTPLPRPTPSSDQRPASVLLPDLQRTLATQRESFLPPKEGQRSLVIVFDATGSMVDDLQQLRDAARLIIAEITQRETNPIFNYVFVPFRDPHVGPKLVTRNQDELLAALDQLQIVGGGDCPEAALEALAGAIELAIPRSFVYVFTDATAKDFRLDKRVLQLVQRKQTPITFLLTGFCDGKNTPGYQVMSNIAAASNGQVFDLRKDQIEQVLLAIRNTMDTDHVPLKAIDSGAPKAHDIDLNVDSTLKEFSVSVAGAKPTIEILDPDLEPYNRSREVLSLDNIRVVNVADPAPGKWNIKASSDSSHSVRLSGLSDVQFKFGFSLTEPTSDRVLSPQPVLDEKNYLAVQPSDPTLIRVLESVTITSHNPDVGGNGGEAVFQFSLPLQQVPDSGGLYRTKAFDSPRQPFKLTINGRNIHNEPMQRLFSTAIQATRPAAPEVSVGYATRVELTEGDDYLLECHVYSASPSVASWQWNKITVLQQQFNQSDILQFGLRSVDLKHAGNYSCLAHNDLGQGEKLVMVKVKPRYRPTIRLLPKYTLAVEREPFIALRCIVDQSADTTGLHWTLNGSPLLMAEDKSYLELIDITTEHAGNYTCHTDFLGERITSENSTIIVEYAPKPIGPPSQEVMREYGEWIELQCNMDGLPAPHFQWYYETLDQSGEQQPLSDTVPTLAFTMTPRMEGVYTCEGRNAYGFSQQTFVLQGAANEAPIIIQPTETTMYVTPGSSITLNCSCELCQPLTEYIWTTELATFESNPKHTIDNIRVSLDNDQSRNAVRYLLTVDNFQPQNVASYTCIFSNQHGADAMILQLRMMVAPELESMFLDAEPIPDSGRIQKKAGTKVSSLSCDANGLPEPTVHWFRNGERLVTNELLQLENDNKTLSFLVPTYIPDIAGRYECTATNPLGSVSSTLDLQVGVAPKVFDQPMTALSSKVGDQITMQCNITGTPDPTIRWEPEASFKDVTKPMQRLLVSYETAGVYRCTGTNDYGTAEQSFTLDTYGPPEIKGALDESVQLGLGQNTQLECFGWAIPEPTISWTFNGMPIESDTPGVTVSDAGLQIWNSSYNHSGVYGCNIQNEHGLQQKIFYLAVRDPPKIESVLDSQVTILPNESMRFECTGTGSPPPNASWLFNGTTLVDGPLLVLPYENATTGTYTCQLESTEGTDRRNMFINKLRPPQRLPDDSDYTATGLTPLKARADEPLILLCPFENYKSLLWQLNEKGLEEHFDLSDVKLKENLLIIDRLRAQHEGTYTCVVQNRAGTDRHSFMVAVLTPPAILRMHPDELSDEYGAGVSEWQPDEPIESAVEVNLLSGETLQLLCQASGTPEPSIHWNRREQMVSATANLTIPQVDLHHSDLYVCVAENELGKSTQAYRLDVMTAPQYYDEPVRSIELFVGDDLELDCTMQANPSASYQWLKEEESLDEFEEILEFVNVQPQDSGMYHCDAENVFGQNRKSFQVLVYQPAEITSFTSDQTLLAGDSIELDCDALGNPLPVLSIIHRGEVLASTALLDASEMIMDQNYRVKSNTEHKSSQQGSRASASFHAQRRSPFEIRFSMRQPNATLPDRGKYLCMAQNAIGFQERLFKLDVMVPPYVQLEKLKLDGSTIQLLEGLPLFLFCPIDGSPRPTIGWYRNSKRLKQSSSTLFLSSVSQRDAGTYLCYGENPIGKTELQYELDVLVPPAIKSSRMSSDRQRPDQQEIAVMAGENVTLDCSSLGNPVPAVFWMKVDYLDEHRNELLAGNPQDPSTIELRNITQTVTYSCYVNNTAGSAQKLYHIVVQTAPTWKDGPDYDYEYRQRVSLHHSLDLSCETDGSPEATVRWEKDGVQLGKHDEGYYFGTNGHTLRLLAARLSDAGMYRCVASNPLGQVSREFEVTINVPVSWSPWGSWSSCSATCGTGTQFRSRICLLLNGSPAQGDQFACVGENVQVQPCELLACPVNGGWSKWSEWSNCSLDCVAEYEGVRSIRQRSRKCNSPVPSLGGKPCVGESYEEEPCRVRYCPIHGGWTPWSNWTVCSEACGFGRIMRLRSCSNPIPRHGGLACEGQESEVRICKQQECNVDGGWSAWGPWTRCSKSCGTGVKSRKRYCNNPEPKAGGRMCAGENTEIAPCSTKRCRNDALLRTIDTSAAGRRNFTPLVMYESNNGGPPAGVTSSHNDRQSPDTDSADYASASGEDRNDIQVVRNYQFAEAPPVEYVDIPPPLTYGIKVTLTNRAQLSNDTVEYNLFFGDRTLAPPTEIQCPQGYEYNVTMGDCSDVDECSSGNYCQGSAAQLCVNTIGSYECQCAPGYRAAWYERDTEADPADAELHCIDINECREQVHECSHFCTNVPGSYLCYCPEQYHLTADGRTCTIKRKRNEPSGRLIGPRCPDGFRWLENRCQDVDECELQADECGDSLSCLNTRGSYLCVHTACPPEYEQDYERETCYLNCTRTPYDCPDRALVGQTLSHLIITLERFNQRQSLAIVSIPADQQTIAYDTSFYFRDRQHAHIFTFETVRKTSGAVRLFANRKLQRGRFYKLHLTAKTIGRKTRRVDYVHDFIVYLHWLE
ncbi:hemicentin-1-like [Anopheles aquasalis]|uniref:hemicentin-1-like n=1 Tax=Anopheles aquasalis TaxID=42839 RepID=UPI00215B06B6|nr:hemicentin-1-like [Anopheles aquasalis]